MLADFLKTPDIRLYQISVSSKKTQIFEILSHVNFSLDKKNEVQIEVFISRD